MKVWPTAAFGVAALIGAASQCILPPPLRAATSLESPSTKQVPANSQYWGVKVSDPYRWLEDASSPDVQAWITAQNSYAEQILSRYPLGKALAARIRHLAITSPQQFDPKLAAGKLFYLREMPPQEQPVLVWHSWPSGTVRVLVDPNSNRGVTAILGYWPSADGRLVAYGTAEAGTEDTEIHVIEAASGSRMWCSISVHSRRLRGTQMVAGSRIPALRFAARFPSPKRCFTRRCTTTRWVAPR